METLFPMKNSTSKLICFIIGVLVLIIFWEVLAVFKNEPLIFPSLIKVIGNFSNIVNKETLLYFFSTISRAIIITVLTLLLGLFLTFIYIKYEKFNILIRPFLVFSKSTPVIVLSIFMFILLGSVISPYVITFLLIMPIAVDSLFDSAAQIKKRFNDELTLLNGSFFVFLKNIYIPLLLKSSFLVLIQTFGLGLKSMIVGEYICQTKNSLGSYMYDLKSNLDITSLIGWLIIITSFVIIIETCLNIAKNKNAF